MKRDSNIDLIRITGFFFVVCVHAYLYNGWFFENQTGILMWLANSFRWLVFSCNGIFMLLTGYLMTVKKWDRRFYRSLPAVILSYIIISAISIPIRHFYLDDAHTFIVWIGYFLSFEGSHYGWYVEMYIGLLLLAPVLNAAMDSLDEKGCRKMLVTMLALTALPNLTPLIIAPDYWEHIYPLTYYVIGAYIRRYGIGISRKYPVMGVTLLPMALGFTTLISTDGYVTDGWWQGYGGSYVVLIAVSVFLLMQSIKIPEIMEKPLQFMAGGTFEGYLISHLFDAKTYFAFPQWRTPEMWLVSFFCITLPIFFSSLLCGKIINLIVKIYLRRD